MEIQIENMQVLLKNTKFVKYYLFETVMEITKKPKILLAFNTFLTHAKFDNVIAFLSVLKDRLFNNCVL